MSAIPPRELAAKQLSADTPVVGDLLTIILDMPFFNTAAHPDPSRETSTRRQPGADKPAPAALRNQHAKTNAKPSVDNRHRPEQNTPHPEGTNAKGFHRPIKYNIEYAPCETQGTIAATTFFHSKGCWLAAHQAHTTVSSEP